MYKSRRVEIVLTSILLIVPFGCKNTSSTAEHDGGSEGEEAGTRFAVGETCDAVRKGVRLILAYDSVSGAFAGTVENVSDQTVPAVRVEVHLSNGTELGPTPRNDLKPGARLPVILSAEGQAFDWWKAHAETGAGEHGHGHGGEHGHEHEGEHAGEHSGEHK
jgi:hypothetical protein